MNHESHPHILIVEDEVDICDLLLLQLTHYHYTAECAHTGAATRLAIQKQRPNLILLDLMLPDISGLELCQQLTLSVDTQMIPIMLLTAKSTEADIIAGFDCGAMDYITKPFSPNILLSRIKACLLKQTNNNQETDPEMESICFGSFRLYVKQYKILKQTEEIALTSGEFNLLTRLLLRRGHILSRNQLLDELSSQSQCILDRNIDVHIHAIRKKLGPNFHWIETIRSVGYRFRL